MFRNLLSIGLVLFILAAGFPVVHKDGSVQKSGQDLMDSIRAVTSLSRSAEDDSNFKAGLGQALTALNEAAGLTQVISSQDSKTYQSIQTSGFVFLPAQAIHPEADSGAASILEIADMYTNRTLSPPFRPPRA